MQYKHAILTFCSSLAKYKIKRLYPFYLLRTNTVNKVQLTLNTTLEVTFIPEPTARSAVRRGLLIPHGYLHPGKCEHSEVAKCKVHQ